MPTNKICFVKVYSTTIGKILRTKVAYSSIFSFKQNYGKHLTMILKHETYLANLRELEYESISNVFTYFLFQSLRFIPFAPKRFF